MKMALSYGVKMKLLKESENAILLFGIFLTLLQWAIVLGVAKCFVVIQFFCLNYQNKIVVLYSETMFENYWDIFSNTW